MSNLACVSYSSCPREECQYQDGIVIPLLAVTGRKGLHFFHRTMKGNVGNVIGGNAYVGIEVRSLLTRDLKMLTSEVKSI